MIDLSDFLLPYPFIITACLSVVIGLIMTLRQSPEIDHDIAKLMLVAWSWLLLAYLFGWFGFVNNESRAAMLRAGLFLLAWSSLLHLIENYKKAKQEHGH